MAVIAPVVPFVRVLKRGSVGRDCIAAKRALSRAGYMTWGDFTNVWGEYAENALKKLEKARGWKITGVYAYTRHEALRKMHRKGHPSEWAFDAMAIAIMRDEDVSPWERVSNRVTNAIDQAILHRDWIPYTMERPYPDIEPYPNLPNEGADCSGFVAWALRSGGPGVPDPNGMVAGTYWRYGFTGFMWARNPVVPQLAVSRVCDLVFYGRPWESGGGAHVAIVRHIEPDGTRYVGSHGSSVGPLNLRATYRQIVGIRRPSLGV